MAYFKNIPYRFGSQVKKEEKLVEARVTKEIKAVQSKKQESDLESLKEQYEALAEKKPHHLWKEARLIDEIDKLKG